MRILHVSDIHCNTEKLVKVLKEEDYELVAATGDFSCLEAVRALEKATGHVLAVTGNCDDPWIADELERRGMSIENKVKDVSNLLFAGVSGQSVETSVRLLNDKSFDILLSHYPPKGCVDIAWSGVHIGLEEVRELVIRKEPILVLSGHVHESRGYCKLGNTLVVNAGPLMNGNYAIINIDNNKNVKVELKVI